MSKREKDNAERIAAGLKPRRRILPWIILALIVIAIVAFILTRPPAPEPVVEEAAAPVMQLIASEVTTVAPQTLTRTVRVTGTLAPLEQTIVSAQVSGRIVSINVRPGDAVSRGDVLIELDREALEIQFEQQSSTAEATRAQLALAEQQLQRTQELIERGSSTVSGLEQAQSNVDALRANLAALTSQVQSARNALENATVTATADGVVAQRSVEPGQTVQPGTNLFTVVDLSRLQFNAAAPLGSSAYIRPGQTVAITVEGVPNRSFHGVVERVNPVAESGTRTIPVYIVLENLNDLLRGGAFATGQITTSQAPDAIAVRRDAIREDAEGSFVLLLENGTIERRGVETGDTWSNALVEITNGLEPGEQIVSAPLTQLEPGDRYELVGL